MKNLFRPFSDPPCYRGSKITNITSVQFCKGVSVAPATCKILVYSMNQIAEQMPSYQALHISLLYIITASPIAFNADGINVAIFKAHSSIASSGKPLSGLVQKSAPCISAVTVERRNKKRLNRLFSLKAALMLKC